MHLLFDQQCWRQKQQLLRMLRLRLRCWSYYSSEINIIFNTYWKGLLHYFKALANMLTRYILYYGRLPCSFVYRRLPYLISCLLPYHHPSCNANSRAYQSHLKKDLLYDDIRNYMDASNQLARLYRLRYAVLTYLRVNPIVTSTSH